MWPWHSKPFIPHSLGSICLKEIRRKKIKADKTNEVKHLKFFCPCWFCCVGYLAGKELIMYNFRKTQHLDSTAPRGCLWARLQCQQEEARYRMTLCLQSRAYKCEKCLLMKRAVPWGTQLMQNRSCQEGGAILPWFLLLCLS